MQLTVVYIDNKPRDLSLYYSVKLLQLFENHSCFGLPTLCKSFVSAESLKCEFFRCVSLCTTPHVTHIACVSGTKFPLLPVSALIGL
jgi:hypothetical protein